MGARVNLFVQPHLDDVPWSCGGLVARLRDEGEACLVATVFTASPGPGVPLGLLARELHEIWGLGGDPIPVRVRENDASLEVLDAEGVALGFREAIYRGSLYDTPEKLLAPPAPDDAALAAAVAERLAALVAERGAERAFLPLGVGAHADHLLCHQAAARLRARGAAVYFYEDFPYVARAPEAVTERVASLGRDWTSSIVDVTVQAERRIAAILAHRSQLAQMFRGRDPRAVTLEYMALVAAGRGCGERYWSPRGTPALALAH